jgi:hypothetical protein
VEDGVGAVFPDPSVQGVGIGAVQDMEWTGLEWAAGRGLPDVRGRDLSGTEPVP